MRQMRIGTIISNIRTSRKITLQELSYGLCSESALFKYESGERIPDSLLVYMLLQRLGEFPARIQIMISKDAANYYDWKKATLFAIQKKDWSVLEDLLDVQYRGKRVLNEKLQLQYELYLRAILLEKQEGNIEKALCCIKEAIELSIPNFDSGRVKRIFWSSEEINLRLMCLSYELRLEQKNVAEVQKELLYLVEFVDVHVQDKFERAKIFPRVVAAMLNLIGKELVPEERIHWAEKAYEVLVETKEIYDLPEIIRWLVIDLKEIQIEQSTKFEKQREVLLDVMATYRVPYEFCLENWYGNNEHICLVNVYLEATRREMNYTQLQISEGICAAENYSRIESGRRPPSVKNYYKLAEKMGIGWGYYRGQIDSGEIEDFHLLTEQRLAYIKGDINMARVLLNRLKKRLDMHSEENLQYIMLQEIIIEHRRGKVSEDEYLVRLHEILKITVSDIRKIRRKFTKTELEVIFQIGIRLRKEKRLDEAVLYLKKALMNNDVKDTNSWYELGGIKRFLLGIYVEKGIATEEMVREIVEEMLEVQDAQFLPELINLDGWRMEIENPDRKDAYLGLYAKTIYLCDLYHMEKFKDAYQHNYEKIVGREVAWY